ncbi:SAVED domain-containing protein [Flavobacterium sufflavum]|uniref:SAVED domain-containing protein n=1 Tax=Flavobacterium sufflavum TaxID=1921138 RepID=A0A437KT83_9FLAO|nr:SAVED domain-containing protein [Flavobacterium sufflavum]RVT75321.1 SAVED domain-containing protein [Flavobacterium sufflavum]
MNDKLVERARKAIPQGTSRKLWVKSGGRCQYDGCNIPLWKDSLMQKDLNKSYISHIIAAKEDGPRGDAKLSKKLEIDFNNLLLLCDECHRRIDKSEVEIHTVATLQEMKKKQERNIELLTGLTPDKKSHIVSFTAKIGSFEPAIKFDNCVEAILPEYYPVSDNIIQLGTANLMIKDQTENYWGIHSNQLEEMVKQHIKPILVQEKTTHFSIFALAPQPLLIKLGTLIPELSTSEIYQLHREPKQTWKWQNEEEVVVVELQEPSEIKSIPVLVLSLSDDVTDDRIHSVLGDDVSIWKISVDNPNRNILKNRQTLINFKNQVRNAYSKIKLQYQNEPIHVFPVMPNSCAVETGRIWMEKADLPLIIYDQNSANNGFSKAIEIKNQ